MPRYWGSGALRSCGGSGCGEAAGVTIPQAAVDALLRLREEQLSVMSESAGQVSTTEDTLRRHPDGLLHRDGPSREWLEGYAEHWRQAGVRAGEVIEWIDRVLRADARARRGELSAEAQAQRAPLRPHELVGALQDRVHRDPGRARAARTRRKTR